jgi:hypothetical protein
MLILMIGIPLLLTPLLRWCLRPRFQRLSARFRYTVFAVLLGVAVSSQILGGIATAVRGEAGLAVLFFAGFISLTAACVSEMRKLSRKF